MRFKEGERSGKKRIFFSREEDSPNQIQQKSQTTTNYKKGHYLSTYLFLPLPLSLLLTHFLSVKTYVVNIVIFAFNKVTDITLDPLFVLLFFFLGEEDTKIRKVTTLEFLPNAASVLFAFKKVIKEKRKNRKE